MKPMLLPRILAIIFVGLFFLESNFQYQSVPELMTFAGIQLKLSSGIRRQIRSDVQQLEKHHEVYAKHAETLYLLLEYLEKLTQEEGLPSDYKYIALVNVHHLLENPSNAKTGFWNLRAEIAEEMNITMTQTVDHRFNLVFSSHAVGLYLKHNNAYFNNWLFNSLTLDLGYEKARKYVDTYYEMSTISGGEVFQVNERTHPFLRKVLAHKLILQRYLNPATHPNQQLDVFWESNNTSLERISDKFDQSRDFVKLLNPWLKQRRIPARLSCPVLLAKARTDAPLSIPKEPDMQRSEDGLIPEVKVQTVKTLHELPQEHAEVNIPDLKKIYEQQEQDYWEEQQHKVTSDPRAGHSKTAPTGVKVHKVQAKQTLYAISKMYGIRVTDIRNANDLHANDIIRIGQELVIPSGHTDLTAQMQALPDPGQLHGNHVIHRVQTGESLYSIAKNYQITVPDLRKWNRLNNFDIIRVNQNLIVGQKSTRQYIQANSDDGYKMRGAPAQDSIKTEPLYQRLRRQRSWQNLGKVGQRN